MFDVILLAPLGKHKRFGPLLVGLALTGCIDGPASGGGGPQSGRPAQQIARPNTQGIPQGGPWLRPVESWEIQGKVRKGKDLSGITLFSPTHGVMVSDEVTSCQVFELDRQRRRLRMVGTIHFAADDNDNELDLEGVAADSQWCYFMGSHGLAKKKGQADPNRMGIIRLPVEKLQQTFGSGQPPEEIDGAEMGMQRSSLASLLREDPVLGPFFAQPLQQRGLNLEGLAVRDSQLLLGVRNPNRSGRATVVQLPADSVFPLSAKPRYQLHDLNVGPGLGIRALTWVGDRFLMIVGNAGSEPSDTFPQAVDYREDAPFALLAWDGHGTATEPLGQLQDPPGKAEAMMLLGQTDRFWELLLLFDGAKEGAPAVYRVPKP